MPGKGGEREEEMGFRVLVYMPAGGRFGTWAQEVESACPAAPVCKVFFFEYLLVLTKFP